MTVATDLHRTSPWSLNGTKLREYLILFTGKIVSYKFEKIKTLYESSYIFTKIALNYKDVMNSKPVFFGVSALNPFWQGDA